MGEILVTFLILSSWFSVLFLALTKIHLTSFTDFAAHLWLFLLIDFLFVGLFIISHDACHGTIAPNSPAANLWIGRLSAFLYGGFIFDHLKAQHTAHHKNSGLAQDPDFHGQRPRDPYFFMWLSRFFLHYFSFFQLLFLCAVGNVLMHIFKVPDQNVFYFWVAPSILSALQLFYFGTFLPHRTRLDDPFADQHRARNSNIHWLLSLLTCYHFGGFHKVHHQKPHIPWFKLPRAN